MKWKRNEKGNAKKKKLMLIGGIAGGVALIAILALVLLKGSGGPGFAAHAPCLLRPRRAADPARNRGSATRGSGGRSWRPSGT